jgi:hypothetical protein
MERQPTITLDELAVENLQEVANGPSDLADPIVGIMAPDEDFDEAFRAVLGAIAELIPTDWEDEEATPHPIPPGQSVPGAL